MRVFFLILALACSGWLNAARADEIPGAPGWTLSRVESQDRVDGDGNPIPFFALKPPDRRPAITIDASTAASLRSGETKPDAAYGGTAETSEANAGANDGSVDLGKKSSTFSGAFPSSSSASSAAHNSGLHRSPASNSEGDSGPAAQPSGGPGNSGGGTHTPIRPGVANDPAIASGANPEAADLRVGSSSSTPLGDLTSSGVNNPVEGTKIAQGGGTGNGGGYGGLTDGGGGPSNSASPTGGDPTRTNNGAAPGAGSTSQTAGTMYADDKSCSDTLPSTGGAGSAPAEAHANVISVVFGLGQVSKASYLVKNCQRLSSPEEIAPSKVTVTTSTSVIVDGIVFHQIH